MHPRKLGTQLMPMMATSLVEREEGSVDDRIIDIVVDDDDALEEEEVAKEQWKSGVHDVIALPRNMSPREMPTK